MSATSNADSSDPCAMCGGLGYLPAIVWPDHVVRACPVCQTMTDDQARHAANHTRPIGDLTGDLLAALPDNDAEVFLRIGAAQRAVLFELARLQATTPAHSTTANEVANNIHRARGTAYTALNTLTKRHMVARVHLRHHLCWYLTPRGIRFTETLDQQRRADAQGWGR